MPPTRPARKSSGPAAKGSQKTLSFSNSKITKSTAPLGKSPLSSKPLPSIKTEELEREIGHVTSEAAVKEQAKIELTKKEKSEEELKAEKITDAQIRKYWKEREGERRSQRVHQEDLSVEEKILRLFDMSSQYGVSPPFAVAWLGSARRRIGRRRMFLKGLC